MSRTYRREAVRNYGRYGAMWGSPRNRHAEESELMREWRQWEEWEKERKELQRSRNDASRI